MRKFGEYVRAAYGCFSAKWIFGVLAALSLLPALTKTVLLCITKESLTAGAVFFADLFCVVCACISAFLAVRSTNGNAKQAAGIWLKGCLPCIAALYAGEILAGLLGGKFGTTGKIIACSVAGTLLGLSFYLLGSAMRGKVERKAGREVARIGIAVLLAIVCCYLLPYFFDLGVETVLFGNKSWSAKLAAELLNTVFRWALLVPALAFICGKEKQSEEKEEAVPTESKRSFLPYIPTCISATVLLCAAVLLFPQTVSPADRLKDEY